ncbi:MAG: cysteine desulfurase family protein [Candidatus Liptonbacteria bacterium]|nr:cysteine desulfurase family protein [Candidatus Liptonbacteria bacterium]
MKKLYFDYAASTPVDSRVLKAMLPYFLEKFGNPGSLHSFGQEAMAGVDSARGTIAKSLGADFRQIIFTSSATEANNLVIKGAVASFKSRVNSPKPRIIVSAIEHESVLESARAIEKFGAEVVYLSVDREGRVNPKELKGKLNERTAIVSVMFGNNEIGTIQPIQKIAKVIGDFRKGLGDGVSGMASGRNSKSLNPSGYTPYPIFHSDASQAFQYLDCNVEILGVDALTISSQKIYGPKGAGALYIKDPKTILPVISGGAQEFGMRSGTENVPAIVGFGRAVELACKLRKAEAKRIATLKNYFWSEIKSAFKNVEVNGSQSGGLPHIINLYFPGLLAEELLTRLDLSGFAVSSGSACRSRSAKPSEIILALGYGKERAMRSLRVSFGRQTGKADIDKLVKELKK